MSNYKCTCDSCLIDSPLVEKLLHLDALSDADKNRINHWWSRLINSEEDVVYWKSKCYGTWPSDTPEDIRHHIELLEKRITELEKKDHDEITKMLEKAGLN